MRTTNRPSRRSTRMQQTVSASTSQKSTVPNPDSASWSGSSCRRLPVDPRCGRATRAFRGDRAPAAGAGRPPRSRRGWARMSDVSWCVPFGKMLSEMFRRSGCAGRCAPAVIWMIGTRALARASDGLSGRLPRAIADDGTALAGAAGMIRRATIAAGDRSIGSSPRGRVPQTDDRGPAGTPLLPGDDEVAGNLRTGRHRDAGGLSPVGIGAGQPSTTCGAPARSTRVPAAPEPPSRR